MEQTNPKKYPPYDLYYENIVPIDGGKRKSQLDKTQLKKVLIICGVGIGIVIAIIIFLL